MADFEVFEPPNQPQIDPSISQVKAKVIECLTSVDHQTFDQIFQKFQQRVDQVDTIRAVPIMAYLLESNVSFHLPLTPLQLLSKPQRLAAYYTVSRLLHRDETGASPSDSLVLSQVNYCRLLIDSQPESFEVQQRQAEYSLLCDLAKGTFQVSLPSHNFSIGRS